jgi:hypothetical protein
LPVQKNQNDRTKCLILLGSRGQKTGKTGFGVELGGTVSLRRLELQSSKINGLDIDADLPAAFDSFNRLLKYSTQMRGTLLG